MFKKNKRETDTFDTFESSWYFVRFTDPTYHDAINHKYGLLVTC